MINFNFSMPSERRENNKGCTDYNLTPSKTIQFSMVSITFFLLSFRLKLPGRLLPGRLLAEPCRMRLLLAMLPFLSAVSLSVGECILLTLRLDMELERFRLEEIPRELGQGFSMSRSSPGRQFSTIMASRQFTSSSAVSLCADLNVPANLQRPPNPILCRQDSCC